MELRVLRYYLEVCEKKNITKAAKALHIAQPSLSTQIKELEKELGVILFERGHREISLTEAGYYLRDKAKEIVALSDQTKNSLQSSALISGTLRIGAGQTYAMGRIMDVVAKISAIEKNVSFQFTDGNADEIEGRINNGTLDFGVIMGDRKLESFNSLILPEKNDFVANFSENHPLASKEKITPKDLVAYPIIISSQTMVTDKFHTWWDNLYDKVNILAESNLAFNVSLLVSRTNAVQITYQNLVDNHDLKITSRPLSPKIADTNIVIWKKNTHLSNLNNLFLTELRNSLKYS